MPAAAERTPRRIALAASPGGHIDLLIALGPAVAGGDRVWVLPDGARRQALMAQGERTAGVRLFGSSPGRLLGNVRDALRALRRARPDIVVTSGAGVVVPYCVFARLLGARVVYMETMARVTSGSRAGRVLSRIADKTLVQWPESLAVYPGARVCAPPLLAPDAGARQPAVAARQGTFIALGTHWQPFRRLMAMVDLASSQGLLPAPVIAQVGEFSYGGRDVEEVPTLPPERIAELMRSSEVVICHGGAGIISTAIRAGRRPLVLARRKDAGEHIDDHQQEIVTKLGSLGLLVEIGDRIGAEEVVAGDLVLGDQITLAGEPMRDALADALSVI